MTGRYPVMTNLVGLNVLGIEFCDRTFFLHNLRSIFLRYHLGRHSWGVGPGGQKWDLLGLRLFSHQSRTKVHLAKAIS